jgi:hypothetical protein
MLSSPSHGQNTKPVSFLVGTGNVSISAYMLHICAYTVYWYTVISGSRSDNATCLKVWRLHHSRLSDRFLNHRIFNWTVPHSAGKTCKEANMQEVDGWIFLLHGTFLSSYWPSTHILLQDSFTIPFHSVFVLSRFRHGSLTLCFILSSRCMPYIWSPPDRWLDSLLWLTFSYITVYNMFLWHRIDWKYIALHGYIWVIHNIWTIYMMNKVVSWSIL